MKRQITAIFAAALALALLLPGCGGGQLQQSPVFVTPTPTPTPDPHAGQIQVPDGSGGLMWVNEAESMAVFSMDAGAFSVTDGRPAYAGTDGEIRWGIDVSAWQHDVDWQTVKDAGVSFAIIRCGYRTYGEGVINEDDYFRANIEGALAAGLEVGVYFFSQAVNIVEAAEEAVFTLSLIEGYDVTLPVFFDWEFIGVEEARTDDLSGQEITDCCLEFTHLVEAAGYDAGVYGYLNLMYNTYNLDRLNGLSLWLGDPGSAPDFYYDHSFWQYSFTGAVPGIEGDVDLNVMYLPADTEDEAI